MKRILILVLMTAGLACDKPVMLNHNDPGQNRHDSGIAGEWEIRKSVGGIIAFIEYAPGNGNIYTFEKDGDFKFTNNGVIGDKGTYALRRAPVAGQWILTLTSTTFGSVTPITIVIDNSELVFLPSATCCDIPAVTYARL